MKKLRIEIDIEDRPGWRKLEDTLAGIVSDLEELDLNYSFRVEKIVEAESLVRGNSITTKLSNTQPSTFGFTDPDSTSKENPL